MPRATCRCGQVLSVPVTGPDRVICPKCSARVRVRRDSGNEGAGAGEGDGFIRFNCPCGRRLKVRAGSAAEMAQQSGKCPECGRVVPVPSSSDGDLKLKGVGGPESPTDELDLGDVAMLDRWTERHLGASAPKTRAKREPESLDITTTEPEPESPPEVPAPAVKVEAGLRICPRCGRPVHLSAVACRNCGAPVPKR